MTQKGRRFKQQLRAILFCLIFVGINCPTAYGADKPYDVTIEEVDGIKTIVNPIHPRDGKVKLALENELVLGDDEDGPSLIAKPYHLHVDSDGNIYYSDISIIGIKIFDKQGKFLRKLGRKGQGPGEFACSYYFDVDLERNVYILDPVLKKVSIFNFDGRLKEERRIEKKGYFNKIDVLDPSNIFLKLKEYSTNEKISDKFTIIPYYISIQNFNPEKKNWNVFLREAEGYDIMKRMGKAVMGFQSRGLWVWKVVDTDTIIAGHNNNYKLGVYSVDGTLRYSFGRTYKRRLSQAKKSKFRKEVYEKIKYQVAFEQGINVDENGRYWIRLPLKHDNQPFRVYDVFSPEGIYLKQIKSELRIACFKNHRVYGFGKSEEDDYLLIRAKILNEIF